MSSDSCRWRSSESVIDGGAFGEEPRRSGRESKAPKDETSWKSASWADTVQKMHAVRVHSGEAQRTEMTRAQSERTDHRTRNRGGARQLAKATCVNSLKWLFQAHRTPSARCMAEHNV